jgi:hypothetical protein
MRRDYQKLCGLGGNFGVWLVMMNQIWKRRSSVLYLSLLWHHQLSERLQRTFWKKGDGVLQCVGGRRNYNPEELKGGYELWLMADGRGL